MKQSIFFEMEFFLLVVFSVVIPVSIYAFLYRKLVISRWMVVTFAILLLLIAGFDVLLLQSLAVRAKATISLVDDQIFSGQLSLTLYLLPAAFAGLAVNLLTHVLVNHLNQAEEEFDRERRNVNRQVRNGASQGRQGMTFTGGEETWVLVAGAAGIALIGVLDFFTGADIRLNVLYVFPLAVVARYCRSLTFTASAFVVTTVLQVVTFSHNAETLPSLVTDLVVATSASLLIVYLARQGRQAYLHATNEAATDTLTGLYNRRAFMQEMETEIARQKRYAGLFSLAVLDLDGFKALNDSLGHAAGDQALTITAEVLQSCTRDSDSIARIGGDEFAILMPNTQDVDCKNRLRQLCATIETRMAAAGFAVTASIGSRTFREPPESTSKALRDADEIMYEAKIRGKNQALHA